jgi:branched-chain amino acid transport system permease protein
VVLAGLGNLAGVIWASLLLGLAEQLVSQYVPGGAALRDGLFFVIIFLVLIVKPSGLRR